MSDTTDLRWTPYLFTGCISDAVILLDLSLILSFGTTSAGFAIDADVMMIIDVGCRCVTRFINIRQDMPLIEVLISLFIFRVMDHFGL